MNNMWSEIVSGDSETRVCGTLSIKCYRSADKRLFGQDVLMGLKDDGARLFRERCNCLAACTTITYNAEVDRAKFDFGAKLISYNVSAEMYSG